MWKPKEIIIHEEIKNDPVTVDILKKCSNVPVKYVNNLKTKTIVDASPILKNTENKPMLVKILAGKQVLFIAPAKTAVDKFTMPDDRLMCPHFDRLKFASNGCYYKCDWCYLKLTYRAVFPYITVRAEYLKIEKQIQKRLNKSTEPVIFNSGELADSLSLEHLTGAAQHFIPWFANQPNGYLFMLTKSDNVDDILNLNHNGRTIIAWSLNHPKISETFEIGAPSFERRLNAAEKVQRAGYPLRIRLDPIVPYQGWDKDYAETIKRIFDKVNPERITLGTLRFEDGFFNMRDSMFTTGLTTGNFLRDTVQKMKPMFEPKQIKGEKRPKVGKYSFTEDERTEIFNIVIKEIQKHSGCKIALCKESDTVWNNTGLDLSKCSCVCQLESADMTK